MTQTDLAVYFGDDRLRGRLRALVRRDEEAAALLPWFALLPPAEQERLRSDLSLLLSEPEATGEPLDWREVHNVLVDYADLANWDGPLARFADESAEAAPYTVDVRPQDLRDLERASVAVRQAAGELLTRFLPFHPMDRDRLERGRLKKLADRGVWQIGLPDGYRLRYFVAEPEKKVFVVYLGPHPDGRSDGREEAAQARINFQRVGEGLGKAGETRGERGVRKQPGEDP